MLQRKVRFYSTASLLLCITFLGGVCSAAFADKSKPPVDDFLAKQYAWFNGPWTDNDAPYATMRVALDHEFDTAVKPADVLQKYANASTIKPKDWKTPSKLKTPYNTKDIFAAAYITYKAAKNPNGISIDDIRNVSGEIETVLWHFSPPHTYNYSRAFFLAYATGYLDPALAGIGKRLLARDRNDYDVEYALAVGLNTSSKTAERMEAIAYQKDLAHRFPSDPRQYRLLGEIYRISALRTHSSDYNDKAIAAYQQYALSAKTASARTEAQQQIKWMRTLQQSWIR